MNNKGISTIVATVLIVLITVAAVTILWAAISPMLNIEDTTTCQGVVTKYQVDTSAEYTMVNSTGVVVRVKNLGDSEASSVNVTISINGTSSDPINVEVPSNQAKIAYLETTVGKSTTATAVIAPIVEINGEETTCAGSAEVSITNKA